ncbi:hypothetical protein ABPG72_001646 [Tetrahymena utriculariae]
MIKKFIQQTLKQNQQLTNLQGSRSAFNQLVRHIREKYEINQNTVQIESKISSSFDGSFEVFLSLDNKDQVQIWSALKGDGRFTQRNLDIFDQRIESSINQNNKV